MHIRVNPRPIALLALVACAILPGIAQAQTNPPVWSNTASYETGDMVTDYGNVYRCVKAVKTPYLDPSKSYGDWELNFVRNNTTLIVGVGQTFPTLQIAWTYAQNAHIAEGAYLHFNISSANGTFSESYANGINLDHPCGASISIIGDTESNINLFSTNGFQLDTGHSIESISGVSMWGNSAYAGTGVALTGNATIGNLATIGIHNVLTGISVDRGAQLNCAASVFLNGCTTAVSATRLGQVDFAPGASFIGNGYGGGDTGLYAAFGGYIEAPSSTISFYGIGIEATQNGSVMAQSASFAQNNYGIVATMKGHVEIETATFATGNNASQTVDIECYTNSTVDGTGATIHTKWLGNADGSYVYD